MIPFTRRRKPSGWSANTRKLLSMLDGAPALKFSSTYSSSSNPSPSPKGDGSGSHTATASSSLTDSATVRHEVDALYRAYLSSMSSVMMDADAARGDGWTVFEEPVRTLRDVVRPKQFRWSDLPECIVERLRNHAKFQTHFRCSVGRIEVDLYFVEESKQVESTYLSYLQRMLTWLRIVEQYGDAKCANTLTVYCYMTEHTKELPTTSTSTSTSSAGARATQSRRPRSSAAAAESSLPSASTLPVLTAEHVNTAFTTSCPVQAEIVIYRKEEWFKVFVHETFHCFHLDFSGTSSSSSSSSSSTSQVCISQLFRIATNVLAYEAYTEFWAEWWNALFVVTFTMTSASLQSTSLAALRQRHRQCLQREREHCFLQIVKLMRFWHIDGGYRGLLFDTHPVIQLREKTAAFSYFVLRGILLANSDRFLAWCVDHGQRNMMDFPKTRAGEHSFCVFLRNYAGGDRMMRGIRWAERWWELRWPHLSPAHRSWMARQLRMTLWELSSPA